MEMIIDEQQVNLSNQIEYSTQYQQSRDSKIYLLDKNMGMERQNKIEIERSKLTMQKLCKLFMQKYKYTQLKFYPLSISEDFNAKLRRVYDMINILQGANIIQKVEKGKYQWKSLKQTQFQTYFKNKNDWCSLRQISKQLKQMFETSNKGWTCNQIYHLMLNRKQANFNTDININPATIRRRIYQCCKVFSNVKVLRKIGKKYYECKSQGGINKFEQNKQNNQNIKILGLTLQQQKHIKQNFYFNKQSQNINDLLKDQNFIYCDQKILIKKISRRFQNTQQLEQFIARMRDEFKSQRNKQIHTQVYEDSVKNKDNEKIMINQQSDEQKEEIKLQNDDIKTLSSTPTRMVNNKQNIDKKFKIHIPQPKYPQGQFNYNGLNISSKSSFKYFQFKDYLGQAYIQKIFNSSIFREDQAIQDKII